MSLDKMVDSKEFSKYERARIIGARGLQISMDAPLLIDVSESELDNMNFDPLKIAEKELDSGVLPISVSKPMPIRNEEAIENVKIDDEVPSDDLKIATEKEIEAEIVADGIMSADDEGEDIGSEDIETESELE
jgi:DNA-directed RNA polymerase subunit K/omega